MIENILKGEDNIVYTSVTDGFGTIENNAQQLKEQILEILEKHNLKYVLYIILFIIFIFHFLSI